MICGLRRLTGSATSGAIGGAGSTTRLAGGWFCIRGRLSVWARAMRFLKPRRRQPRGVFGTEYHGYLRIPQRDLPEGRPKTNGPDMPDRRTPNQSAKTSEILVAR